METRKRI